jgi:hypothetical protein
MADDPVSASSRGFTFKNEKKTEKYLNELEKYFKDHKICERINKLMEEAGFITRKQIKRWYEGIDNDVTRGMLSAERKVRPHQTFQHDWFPELDKARYRVRYWRVRYSDVKNNSTSHKALGQSFKRAALKENDNDPSWDEDKVLGKLKEACATLKVAQKKHWENHDAGL